MSNKSVQKALSHVTGSDLRSFSLVHCNIEEKGGVCTPEELDAFHYLCFGKHKLFILDREMKGPEHDGKLVTIQYSNIAEVATHPNDEPELFYITFMQAIPNCPKILEGNLTTSKKSTTFLIILDMFFINKPETPNRD